MKRCYKVMVVSVALILGSFALAKCYDTYFERKDNNAVVLKDAVVNSPQQEDKGTINEIQQDKATKKSTREDSNNKRGQAGRGSVVTKKSFENLFSAYDSSNPSITVIEGDGSSYLTNKREGVLVQVDYTGSGDKTIKIGDKDEITVSKNEPYRYICRVADNVSVVAKSGSNQNSKTINNMVTVKTGCDVTTGYVKDKTYYSAVLGGKVTGTVDMSSSNIKELGVRYWRGDMEDEIYTVKTQQIKNYTYQGQKVTKGTNSISYELLARSLKENTIYYMQAYMINSAQEVLLGDVVEFSTLGHGIGLYGLYYKNNDDTTPALIKQETAPKMTISVPTGYNKVKWKGEVAPLNSGLLTFKVTSSGNVSIKIADETLSFSTSGETKKTSNIYKIGQKYPITIEAKSVSGTTVKVEWKEDRAYQEIHKEQLYPKEYVKIESAVVNSKGTDNQEIDKTTGKAMQKKVITNGQNLKTFGLTYNANNVAIAATVTIDKGNNNFETNNYTIVSGEGNYPMAELIGWLVYNTNGVIEPLTENVSAIDYNGKTVTLRNGSVWSLYDDVEVVGRLMQSSDRKVYDLGRYITSASDGQLSDNSTLGTSDMYRADDVDNTYIVNLYNRENASYQQALEQYSTMERFVEDAKSVDKWNLAIGEGRLYSIVPIRILLSFDGNVDGELDFAMKNPVIRIKKDLFKTKQCATDNKDGVFKLDLPTNASGDEITSLYYADWRYMNDGTGSYNREATENMGQVTIKEDGDHFDIKLSGYEALNTVAGDNIMVNVLLRVDSIAQKTSKEVFDGISASEKIRSGYNLNGSYRTYTKATLISLNGAIDTDVTEVPIEIKVKPQVTFE